MLLDSNMIIYAVDSKHDDIQMFIGKHEPAVSVISQIEVLGYEEKDDTRRRLLEEFFANALVLPLSPMVVKQAIKLRKQRKMDLGDSIIAATAIVHRRKLVTRNIADFEGIKGLVLYDPDSETTMQF